MKRIYITSLFRGESQEGDSGNFYVYDFEKKELIEKINLSSTFKGNEDYTGRSRGLRGLEFYNGDIYLFTSSAYCFILHPDTYKIRKEIDFQEQITNDAGSFIGVHQVKSDGEYLWVTGTREDKLVKVYGDQVVDIQELSSIEEHIKGYNIENNHPWGKDRLHFNSIDFNQGKMYHTYYNAKMVYNYTNNKVVTHNKDFDGLHDVHFLSKNKNGFLFNSSNTKTTYKQECTEGNCHTEYFKCNWESAMKSRYNEFGYTRGIAHGDGYVFLGFAPVVLNVVEHTGHRVKIYPLVFSFDPNESLYDVILDPRDWSIL